FALEESAGNLAGRVGLLLVVDGQRKEILAGLRVGSCDDGDEHDGVVEARDDRTAGLAGGLPGLERQGGAAGGEGFLDGVHIVLVLQKCNGRAIRSARPLAVCSGTLLRRRRSHRSIVATHRSSRKRRQRDVQIGKRGSAYLRSPSFSINVR